MLPSHFGGISGNEIQGKHNVTSAVSVDETSKLSKSEKEQFSLNISLIRFYNPIGFWLLLWPGLWGLFLSDNFNIQNFMKINVRVLPKILSLESIQLAFGSLLKFKKTS